MSCIFFIPVIWKEQVVLVVGAASSRDHLILRLEAAPTGFFYGNLDFPYKRLFYYRTEKSELSYFFGKGAAFLDLWKLSTKILDYV